MDQHLSFSLFSCIFRLGGGTSIHKLFSGFHWFKLCFWWHSEQHFASFWLNHVFLPQLYDGRTTIFHVFFLWFRYFLHTLWQGPDRFKCNVFNYDDHWSSSSPYLVGGLEHDFYFPIEWECHHPNWLSYFSEGFFNHQPASIDYP